MAPSTAARRRSKAIRFTEPAASRSGVSSDRGKVHAGILSATRRASEKNLDRQIQIPVNTLIALVVMHLLSSPSSLSLAHLSTHLHLPQTLHSIIPSWLRLPSLEHFASDLPNASERGSHFLRQYAPDSSYGVAGPFRSDARGFGHPLTALHNFTRAALGLAYPVPDPSQSPIAALKHQTLAALDSFPLGSSVANQQEPWAFMGGVPGYLYRRGPKDALIVGTMVLVFTALRAILMKYVLLPMGEQCVPRLAAATAGPVRPDGKGGGVSAAQQARESSKATRTREKEVLRFAEQGFSLVYYVGSWSLGLYIASQTSYWPMRTTEYWSGYPSSSLDALTKLYYLGECAFYIQQLFVLNVEARRSDHWQMFSHHVITIALISGSYVYSFHRVGNAILCLMDPSDICLALAKMLKYSGLQTVCDVAFGIFMLSWLVTRHVLYMVVLHSCISDFRPSVPSASPDGAGWNPAFSPDRAAWGVSPLGAYWGLIVLLLGLQVILLLWFAMILRVAWRVVMKAGAVDSRSDEESEEEEGEEEGVVVGGREVGRERARWGVDGEAEASDAQLSMQVARGKTRRRTGRKGS